MASIPDNERSNFFLNNQGVLLKIEPQQRGLVRYSLTCLMLMSLGIFLISRKSNKLHFAGEENDVTHLLLHFNLIFGSPLLTIM